MGIHISRNLMSRINIYIIIYIASYQVTVFIVCVYVDGHMQIKGYDTIGHI